MPESTFTRSYNSFSGIDIQAVVGTQVLATLQGISYQISREKAPIFTMGSADPRGFARGKRAIAGSLVFIQFDSEPLMQSLAGRPRPILDIDEVRPEFLGEAGAPTFESAVTPVGTASTPGVDNIIGQESDIGSVGADMVAADPWYADQILPFDIILAAANEYGALAQMKILGIELMNQGTGVSIDDIVCEHSYTYVALGIIPWTSYGLHPDAPNQ